MTTPDAPNLHWRISTFSGTGSTCVEVANDADNGVALVRNSVNPDAGTLTTSRGVMAAWVSAVKAGDFDDLAG